ncbi:MAG: IS21 family transposase [Candidatus Krumholzibacteriia bacterium]
MMLDQGKRTAILELKKKGLSNRRIARTLGVSRGAVRAVLESGKAEVPRLERAEKAAPFRDRILELYVDMKGNLVRVHEEIVAEGCDVSYASLTSFCRRHGIGVKPRPPAGRYHFEPGSEMQHDTSPHTIEIAGKKQKVQVASLVLCYSRLIYFQYYPTFTRFDCKVFLTDALQFIGGSAKVCMIDNTHVVVLKGTGAAMVPVPEMEAFAEHFGFGFRAHEVGDANRSARVERPFHHIENNFEVGRKGHDLEDWNRQATLWCEKVNATLKRHLKASPRELFALERSHLMPLPDWIPEVYRIHQRIVDVEGYVRVSSNHYSVPLPVGRSVEVRETRDRIDVYDGPRRAATHKRVAVPANKRVTDPQHRPPRGEGRKARESQEEKTLLRLAPELGDYVRGLKRCGRGPAVRSLRRLLVMVRDYPRAPLEKALEEAKRYGLYDLERVERMVLRRIGEDFFFVNGDAQGGGDE